MKRFKVLGLSTILSIVMAVPAAVAQSAPPPPTDTSTQTPSSPAPAQSEPGLAGKFLRDLGGDYKHFFSKDTALFLGIGGAAALGVHQADQSIADHVQASNPDLDGGEQYGSQLLQVPVAIGWWIAGAAAGSERNAATGRDLLRAQIQAFTWTYAIKYATDRTRPNGDPRSFPSGHASTSFATAMVLQEHFGWKLGLPAFAMASYTAASRVTDNQHWTSDVVFGAALGMACGWTATKHLRDTNISVAPIPMKRGGGVLITAVR